MKTRSWAIIFAAAAVLCTVFYFAAPRSGGDKVGIYQDGELVRTVDLSAAGESYEIVLEKDGRKNVILVSDGSICVKEANCPDGTCVDHGPLEGQAAPIVCLPNKVVIKYVDAGGGDVDAVAGVSG